MSKHTLTPKRIEVKMLYLKKLELNGVNPKKIGVISCKLPN